MTAAPTHVRAAVSDGHSRTSMREFSLEGTSGWVRVESSAICGTDVQLHSGRLSAPAVLGHHVVGVVEHVSEELASTLGVTSGQRVALEEYLRCGVCADCITGNYRFCARADLWTGGERVGMVPASRGSGLHGGNAEYLELSPHHAAHPVPETLNRDNAAWILPFANAWDWTVDTGGVGPDTKVGVIGPGYHGIACVAAARAAGAKDITALGLPRDTERLRLAEGLGAHAEIVDDAVVERVRRRTGGLDVVIDTAGTAMSFAAGVQMSARFGTLVVAGLGGQEPPVAGEQIVRNLLTVRGVRGRSPQAVSKSIELLNAGVVGLESIPAYHVGLEEVGEILVAMSDGRAPTRPHVVVIPEGVASAVAAPHTPQETSS